MSFLLPFLPQIIRCYVSHDRFLKRKKQNHSQWVALKIKKSSISSGSYQEDQEVRAIIALENLYNKKPSREPRCFSRLLDAFQLYGPNGVHNCLVMELVGPSISKILHALAAFEEILRPDTVLRAARRLLQGICFAHDAGVVHGGRYPIMPTIHSLPSKKGSTAHTSPARYLLRQRRLHL